MKPWVLIDISYLAHRARYATANLEYKDFGTGVLFGFWGQLLSICRDPLIKSNRVLLFFDSRKNYRRRHFPDYKAKRHEDASPEERQQLIGMYEQLNLLRIEILPAVGFPVYRQTGCESDDLMAQAALQLDYNDERGIIVTADGDLWQCITRNIHWYDPARQRYYDYDRFRDAKGIDPGHWGMVKAIGGCSGDSVPGVKGVGEKSAIKYLKHELPTHHKRFKNIESAEGQWTIDRNKPLVVLPHTKTKPLDIRPPEYNADAFFHYAERYGFLTYLNPPKRGEWEDFFGVQRQQARRPKRSKR